MICKKSFNKRREIVNSIPYGMYCYNAVPFKLCKYWKGIKSDKHSGIVRGKCKLYNVKDKYDQDLRLLWDQCKICNIKNNLRNDIHLT